MAVNGIVIVNGAGFTGTAYVGGGGGGGGTGVLAVQSDLVVDSYSVVTHLDYNRYTNLSDVIAPVSALGVRHLRMHFIDGTDGVTQLGRMQQVYAATGARFYGPVGKTTGNGLGTPGTTGTPESIVDQVGQYTGASTFVEAFEGSNEDNLQDPGDWAGHTVTHQTRMYAYVKGYGGWVASTPVVGPSIGKKDAAAYTALATAGGTTLQNAMDYGNVHLYDNGESTGDFYLSNIIVQAHNVSGSGKGLWSTEGGTHNALQSTGDFPMSETADGYCEPKRILEYFLQGLGAAKVHGMLRCGKYELLDQGTSNTDKQQRFGLVRFDGTYKPALLSVANLFALLADPGSPFTPGRLDYLVTSGPSDLRQILLQKRDGSFWLVLWRSVSVWNKTATPPVDITVPNASMTLNVPTLSTMTTYEPTSSATALSTVTGISTTVTLGGGMRVIKIVPL